MSFQAIILAAGKGTRMKSSTVKVLHDVLGRPMIDHVVRAALDAGADRVIAITGHQREDVEAHLTATFGDRVAFAVQAEQHGTGHAVWCARDYLGDNAPDLTVVLSGDVPNMDATTVRDFVHDYTESGRKVGMMTAVIDDPAAYGRVIRRDDGSVDRIVEFKDASEAERAVQEINVGTYIAPTAFYFEHLGDYCSKPPENAQNEWYLPVIVDIAADHPDWGVFGWALPEVERMQGVNTRADLAAATDYMRRAINARWMAEGVTMLDPNTTWIEVDVRLEPDVTLHPNVELRGTSAVAGHATIQAGCVLENSTIGPRTTLKPYCHLEDATVAGNASVGPFAHLRPGSDIGDGCKIGNFVETKKTRMEPGSKASHLTYLGDAHVGANANIGAGTITCNYDGRNKHQTVIGPGAFIGSNTALVAPIKLGTNAYVGAGSTLTQDVPDHALGVARGRQRNIEDWAKKK
jgi:bifunctional UDP-N-acetylglucosamine pyrophosphorylase/glucosamine-1-phosphate N-acetyltransferase